MKMSMLRLVRSIYFIPFIFSLALCIAQLLVDPYNKFEQREEQEEQEEAEEALYRDRMDLAMQQEFEMTKDPQTNTVPRERLAIAQHYMESLLLQAKNNKVAGALAGINWQERGPNNLGGRTRTIMVDPNDPSKKKVWSAGVAGGLWMTTDITQSAPAWAAANDFFTSIAITTMCYSPANTQIFYFGTGEGYFNADYQRGNGIWKSTDGGVSWNQLASTASNANFYYVNRMTVGLTGDVYAATNSGVFRSQDAGVSWSRVLGASAPGGAVTDYFSDIEVSSSGEIWASTLTSGAVYKSPSGNAGTWTQLNTGANGFPASGASRIDIALAPSNANVCYAFVAQGGVNFYKTADGGANWTLLTKPVDADPGIGNDITRTQYWYDMSIAVDPNNDAVVFVGGVDLFKSSNSGTSWQQISHWYGGYTFQDVHADQHIALFEPGNSNVIYFGNDGGIWRSSNATAVIPTIESRHDNYNVTQFYACAIHPTAYSNYFLAGAQDNGSHQFTSGGLGSTTEVTGGDGCFVHIDQNEPQYQFTSYVYSNYYRSTDGGATFSTLTSNNNGSFVNPSDYDNLNNNLYSAYSGGNYSRILNAPVLNTLTPVAITAFGGSSVSTVSCSQNTGNRVFFGLSNGRVVQVDNAHSATPTGTHINSGMGMPGSSVSCIAIENGNDAHLLVTYSGYGTNSVWETINGGASWVSVEGNLPDMPIRCALFSPLNNQQALVGTELGVWSTDLLNGVATNWGPSSTGLANTRVTMLQTRPSDNLVIASTHGRGLFSSDIFAAANADFVANKIITYVNKPITFSDASYKSLSWNWNFGDGGNSAVKNPVYSYSSPGLYTVALEINGSVSASKVAYIQVLPNRGTPYTPVSGGNFEANVNDFGPETFSGTPFQRGNSAIAGKNGTFSGSNTWVTGISSSSYASNTDARLYTPNYNFTAVGSYTLSFYRKNNVELGWDGFRVEYSLNKGDTWIPLGTAGGSWYDYANTTQTTAFPINQPYFNALRSSFTMQSIDLTFLGGNPNVAFRFVFKSDGTINNSGVAIDDFQISGPTNDPLPVELLSFTGAAKENYNELNWTTATEINNSGFEIERSSSGFDWTKIGFVSGAGNSVTNLSYTYKDYQISDAAYYYRLKQVDFNGKSTYTKAILLSRKNNQQLLVQSLFPNPFQSLLNIDFTAELTDKLQVELYALNGKLLATRSYPNPEKNYQVNFDDSQLPEGVYVLKLISDRKTYSRKIVKTN